MKKITYLLLTLIVFICSVLFLGLTAKGGISGNTVLYQAENSTALGGPFEASNSTARYALTESIVKDHSLTLSRDLAKFSAPDVVQYKGKFVSIFTPGVSFIGVPFYMLGLKAGYPQIFTYISVALFSVINIFLVAKLSQKLGASYTSGLLAGFIFIFATNALTYAQSFTQHQMSTTFILLALLNALEERTWSKNILFGMYFGIATLVDIPNPLMLFPVLLFVFIKHFKQKTAADTQRFNRMNLNFLWLAVGVLPFLLGFAYYNKLTTGNFGSLAQNIGRTDAFSNLSPDRAVNGPTELVQEPTLKSRFELPFSSRAQLEGIYTLYISDERSWIYYSPIVLLGIPGLVFLYKNTKTRKATTLIISIITVNALIYSMFGDPWGGWSFGPRYLIPVAALMLAASSVVVDKFKGKLLFFVVFVCLSIFSVYINVLGVSTTSLIPPKVEAVNLPDPIPYTWKYNLQILDNNKIASLSYNLLHTNAITSQQYVIVLTTLITLVILMLYSFLLFEKKYKI